MAAPGFWDNQEKAQERVSQLKGLKSVLAPMTDAISAADDLGAMVEMGEEDASFVDEVQSELDRLEKIIEQLELKTLLSGPHDGSGAIMTINAPLSRRCARVVPQVSPTAKAQRHFTRRPKMRSQFLPVTRSRSLLRS